MRGFPGLDKGKGLQLTSYYLRAQPPIIDTFPLLVYSLLLRQSAGESMSLNLGPVFVASQIIEGGTPFHTHVQIVLKNFPKF